MKKHNIKKEHYIDFTILENGILELEILEPSQERNFRD